MEQEPNQGATGEAPAEAAETAEGPPPEDAGPGEQGAQSPLSAQAASQPFERPEVLLASAFVGGFAAAQILRWLGNR